jgi:AraC family transcriptional regulator
MSSTVGAGDFIPWNGGCLVIGRAAAITPMHSHYAIQIAFGSERGILFSPSERVDWTQYDGVIISSRQLHRMDATRVSFDAVLFVEPETRQGRALSARFKQTGITALSAHTIASARDSLFTTWRAQGNSPATAMAAQNVIDSLTGGVEPVVVSDERILKAIAYINGHLNTSLTLKQVAGEAFLSPSRFRHLFVQQTGTALRPYVLWRRFLRAWEAVMRGGSLSTAAHEAGFADSAHFTRTSHRMFGFRPSALEVNVLAERGRSVGVHAVAAADR